MRFEDKRKRLQSLSERELRQEVIVPLFQAAGYSGVYEFHGPTEKGKDIIFREITVLGDVFVHAAVVSTHDLTGTVGDSRSALRILEQVEMALNEPYQDKYTGETTEVDRCWVVTSGRILSSATASISARLQKYNFSKILRFIDGDRLIELIDKHYRTYWSEEESNRAGSSWEVTEPSPNNQFGVRRAYSLLHAGIVDFRSGKELLAFEADVGIREIVSLWSLDCSHLAYYSAHARAGYTDIIHLSELGAKLLAKPEIKLPFQAELEGQR